MLEIQEKYLSEKNNEINKMEKSKKTYTGPATEFTDPDEAKKIRARELKA
mgnify:CR=1 FL=1|jgi:hypothetical protein